MNDQLNSATFRVDKDNSVKHQLKVLRWQFRRMITVAHWGTETMSELPALVGNAMPKSGSHLISQILRGLTKIGPFVDPGFPPLNRTEDNRQLSDKGILANIYQMKPGDVGYGYLKSNQQYIDALNRPGMASVFVYRDPRDMIISHIFYATDIFEGHGMHRYYTENLETIEARIDAAIFGVNENGLKLVGVKARYEGYQGWLSQPEILKLKFEDLILHRDQAINELLDFLEQMGFRPEYERGEAIRLLVSAISPGKSGTFRKGKPGNWREHFTQQNIINFKDVTGDLLVQLGYERNNDWQ